MLCFSWDFVQFSRFLTSPQSVCPPSHPRSPSVPWCNFYLLSVAWLHYGPSVNLLRLGVMSLGLCLQPQSVLVHLDQPSRLICFAPCPLDSGVDHWPLCLTGLPWHFGSTWVRHYHIFAVDLRAVRCSPALHPFPQSPPPPSVTLAPPQPSGTSLTSWEIIVAASSQPPRSSASHHSL